MDALRRGDHQTALRNFEPLARKNDAKALNRIGEIFDGKWFCQLCSKMDSVRARENFLKAKDRGSLEALLNLYYLSSSEKKQDEALAWLKQAAEVGYPPGQWHLARKFYRGSPLISRDFEKALFWYRKAAAQGYNAAFSSLSNLYARGRGVKKNLETAYFWATLALENVGERIRYLNHKNRESIETILKIPPSQIASAKRRAREWLEEKGWENKVVVPKAGTGKLFPYERVNRTKLMGLMDKLKYGGKLSGAFAGNTDIYETSNERVLYYVTRNKRHPAYPALIRWRVVQEGAIQKIVIDGHYAGSARGYWLWLQRHKADLKQGKKMVLHW